MRSTRRPHGHGWLIPAFQLSERGELPHLAQVPSAAQRHLSALSLAQVFTLPNDELGGTTPRDWLLSGGDTLAVERTVAGL